MELSAKIDPGALAPLRAALARALGEVAEDALAEAQRVVPIEEGDLSRSGFVQVDEGSLTAQVAFDEPYAVRQHEDPTLKHDAGRTDHYLTGPVEERRAQYVRHLQEAAARASG